MDTKAKYGKYWLDWVVKGRHSAGTARSAARQSSPTKKTGSDKNK